MTAGEARGSTLEVRGRPLALVGLRGAGKSSAGRLVADRLARPFVDLDRDVAELAGRPIARLFAEDGEARFRELEAHVLECALTRADGPVVATGGGVVLLERNRAVILSSHAYVVYLSATPATLAKRVAGDPASVLSRPALVPGGPLEEATALLGEREPLYRALASVEIVTDGLSVEEVASGVLGALSAPP